MQSVELRLNRQTRELKLRGTRLDHLEELAEELIKNNPEEALVRAHMKAAGLRYTEDPVDRLTAVLKSLDKARMTSEKGATHGKDL